jgi:hypothetical protein
MKKIKYISSVFDEIPATDFVARTLIVRRRKPPSWTSDEQVRIEENDRLEYDFQMRHHRNTHIM